MNNIDHSTPTHIYSTCDRVVMNKSVFEKDVAKTILLQIEQSYSGTINIDGETRPMSALALMGAHGFLYSKNNVQFAIKGNVDFNKVVIKLVNDTYSIELWNVKVTDEEPFVICEKVDEYNDIYAEQLGNLLVREVCY